MSIERMSHVAILAPAREHAALLEWLYGAAEVHLAPFREPPDDWKRRFRGIERDPSQIEARCGRLQQALGFLTEASAEKPGFLEGLFSARPTATSDEVAKAVEAVDADWIAEECRRLSAGLDACDAGRQRLAEEAEALRRFAFLGEHLPGVKGLKHVALIFAAASPQAAAALRADARAAEAVAFEAVGRSGGMDVYALLAPSNQDGLLRALVAEYGLLELKPPEARASVAEELRRIESRLDQLKAEKAALRQGAEDLAARWKRLVELALAHWESERFRIERQGWTVASSHVFAARGYVRSRRLENLRGRLAEAFPGAAAVVCPPPAGEEPPVSLRWGRFVRPAGLLVKMFGLPRYNTFDPTPYLTLVFLAFFGICFSDMVYGLMLVGVALLLKRRFRTQPGLCDFFSLFVYAGVSTTIFGAMMGSMASDLPRYFGDGNPLERLRQALMLIDPLAKPVVAILIAVGIGVLNQFYGIVLRFLRDWRRGDRRAALYDGVLWLAYLVSLLVTSLSALHVLPAVVMKPSLGVLCLSAVGLVLTQGRDQEGWAARLITGVVSLYGILGNYGTSTFIGDVLSYTRLLALGLTTSIVGMAFNLVAGLVKMDVFIIGWMLFAAVAVFGHLFNFVMSMLGAFVHPARLMFLEFFGRFYEIGGEPFEPFGFASSRVIVAEGSPSRNADR